MLNWLEKMTRKHRAVQMAVSTSTQCHRASLSPAACSVRPDEYRSSVLTASSVTIAKSRYGTDTQPGRTAGMPPIGSLALMVAEATAAPRTSSSMAGRKPPAALNQNTCLAEDALAR